MLDKPNGCWSRITIGEWSERCSDADDVPFMLLEALEESCRTYKPIAVKFDAEGYEYIIVFDWIETHIISDKDNKYTYTTIAADRDVLAHQLIVDILADLDDWAAWRSVSDDECEERMKDLAIMCDILNRRIPSDGSLYQNHNNQEG